MSWYKILKIAANIKELRQVGVKVEGNFAILYRGSDVPDLTQKDLRYGDFLSSVPKGSDATGNLGADSYGKYVIQYKIPVNDIKITNGELQYIGHSQSLNNGQKYPLKIYRAFNDYYGSNYTSQEIDNHSDNEVRNIASMALSGGKEEFDELMRKFRGRI